MTKESVLIMHWYILFVQWCFQCLDMLNDWRAALTKIEVSHLVLDNILDNI